MFYKDKIRNKICMIDNIYNVVKRLDLFTEINMISIKDLKYHNKTFKEIVKNMLNR